MSEAPERIWLQWEDHAGESTWCQDQINDDDVQYLRADLHTAEVEALRKENERLREATKELVEVSARAIRLSLDHPETFRVYAMDPLYQAISAARAAIQGETP